MYINEFKASLPYLFKAKVVPFAWGPHGVGKTSAIQQFADEGGHKLFTLALGNVEIPDILGVMDKHVDEYTGKVTSSRYLMPEFFKELFDFCRENPDKYSILFLDELNHARKDVLSPVFQMITGGGVHTYKFPENFRIAVASNPPTDDYPGVLNLRNQALLDRFCHLNIQPNPTSWIEGYAVPQGLSDDIVQFIRNNPDHLRSAQVPFSSDQFAKPSERSWDYVNRLYAIQAPKELIYGMVGTATGTAWYAWMDANKEKLITGEEILAYNEKTRTAVLKLIKEEKFAEVQKVVDAFRDTVMKKTAELHALYEKGEDKTDGKCTPEECRSVVQFLKDLPEESMMAAFPQLSNEQCRYIGYTVFDDQEMVDHFKKVLESTKKAEKKASKKGA